jgi:hypothetical protein
MTEKPQKPTPNDSPPIKDTQIPKKSKPYREERNQPKK